MSETKPDLMAELAEVVRLSESATPGPWKEWRDGAADYAKVDACPDGPNIANTGRLGWNEAIENAQLIAAAVNFLRTHHAELEAVVRDAQTERAIQRAAEVLPIGYELTIVIERDAGTVELTDHHGDVVSLDADDHRIASQINNAVDQAMHNSAREG